MSVKNERNKQKTKTMTPRMVSSVASTFLSLSVSLPRRQQSKDLVANRCVIVSLSAFKSAWPGLGSPAPGVPGGLERSSCLRCGLLEI